MTRPLCLLLLMLSALAPTAALAQEAGCDRPKTCAEGQQWNPQTGACETVSS